MMFAFIILGLLQGLTEFLPVSSSGHLVLFSSIFGINDSLFVSILLHIATLLSVLIVMRKDIWEIIKNPFSEQEKKLIISTLVTIVFVLILYKPAKSSFSENILPFSFMLTACVLLFSDLFAKGCSQKLSTKQAIFMGIAQGIAIFPGISRSGSTICAGVLSGGDKNEVSKHSFLMSIPIILASMFVEILDIAKGAEVISVPVLPLIVSFLVAFISGTLALKFMLKYSTKMKYRYFAIYLFAISIVTMFI